MFNLSTKELEKYIQDDIPYDDLTTSLQNCKDKKAKLEVYTREDIIVSCTEEASKIAKLLDCEVDFYIPSKQKAKKNEILLKYHGDYENIHKAWRLSQVLLEYSCKISTYAFNMKEKIEKVNKTCELLTTRKTFPLSKRFCIKAAICGGALPHRLGLSESTLFFDGHRIIYKDMKEFYEDMKRIKKGLSEKKLVVESDDYNDCIKLMEAGVDVIQLDKVPFETLEKILNFKEKNFPNIKIILAGGINIKNAQEYAKYPIDAIVTSAVYLCGMADISSRLELL